MITTYEETLDWIHGRLRLGIKPGLKRMEWMMERLQNPHLKQKTIHIGGTNGKGSTVTFVRSILQEAGYTVGTFTSPFIEQFNERISVNGIPISNEEMIKLVNIIEPLADELENTDLGGPTEFEVITAMAFQYFAQKTEVDIVLFEVGLGGRFDSTNIVQPLVSIITNVGFDHMAILGNTIDKIAFEKAGIIKKCTPCITAVSQPEAIDVIRMTCRDKEAPLTELGQQLTIKDYRSCLTGEQFSLKTNTHLFKDLKISMKGKHQTENASLAVMSCYFLQENHGFVISDEQIRTGLLKAFWPGRFEVLQDNPPIIIDGAHNVEGVITLVDTIQTRYRDKNIKIIFAALGDKRFDDMIALLDKISSEITFVSFDFPRAATAKELFSKSNAKQKQAIDNWKIALQQSIMALDKKDVLLITGSLYFISEVKPFILDLM